MGNCSGSQNTPTHRFLATCLDPQGSTHYSTGSPHLLDSRHGIKACGGAVGWRQRAAGNFSARLKGWLTRRRRLRCARISGCRRSPSCQSFENSVSIQSAESASDVYVHELATPTGVKPAHMPRVSGWWAGSWWAGPIVGGTTGGRGHCGGPWWVGPLDGRGHGGWAVVGGTHFGRGHDQQDLPVGGSYRRYPLMGGSWWAGSWCIWFRLFYLTLLKRTQQDQV